MATGVEHYAMNKICLISLVAAALCTNATRAAEPRQAPITKEQLKQQAALIAEFRRARQSPEVRLELIERAADLSPHTLKTYPGHCCQRTQQATSGIPENRPRILKDKAVNN